MELTPELFEKIEFTERRKGYDTEQVETFLEQAGTALAQMLARVRHTEERAAHAESRLAEAEQKLSQADQVMAEADRRVQQAEQRVQQASQQIAAQEAAGSSSARLAEEAEVEQAAKTLLMARRTAEATVNEARGQAQSLLEDARARSDRQLQQAETESEEMLRQAAERAEAEYADRRSAAVDEVQSLELRRSQLNDVLSQLENRLSAYRADLLHAAEELVSMADDPQRLGVRPGMSIRADEVLTSEPAPTYPDDSEGRADDEPELRAEREPEAEPEQRPEPRVDAQVDAADAAAPVEHDLFAPEAPQNTATAPAPEPELDTGPVATATIDGNAELDDDLEDDDGPRTEYLDLTAGSTTSDAVSADDRWGPGSWSDLETELDEPPAQPVARADTPRDRFMEELDSAVNEAVELDDDAMTAFFEGTSDSRARRFGWRR